MKLNIDKNLKNPLYIQIYDILKTKILKGELSHHSKLPPVRNLANDNNVNTSTIVKAYNKLQQENLIYKKVGSGSFVSSIKDININEDYDSFVKNKIDSTQLDLKDNINFASATPSHNLFPIENFKISINKVLDRDGGKAFDYQNTQGFIPLRKQIADMLLNKNINTSYQDIQIVSGAQQAIDIISKIFINEGNKIAVESPTYSGAIASFKDRKSKIHSFVVNENGIDLDNFEIFLKNNKISIFYTMPNFQNPTGIKWNIENKEKLIYLSNKYDFYIIEDDCISELNYFDDEVKSLKSIDKFERVIYIKSYSKIFMPGLRLGFMIFPKSLSAKIISTKYSSDISSSGLNQRAFEIYLKSGDYEKHIEKIKILFKERFLIMRNILKQYNKYFEIYKQPKGGLYFWVKYKKDNFNEFIYKSRIHGVSFLPEKYFKINNSNEGHFFRLSFADSNIDEIKKGMNILYRIADYNSKNNIQPIV